MLLPIALIVLATVSAALVSYGVHPDWAQYESGIAIIILSRRLMWPLIAVSLALCIGLLTLVISGRRRAWWLIGLAPVLALFVHRFSPGSMGPGGIVDSPTFVEASHPAAVSIDSGDFVVGIVFRGRAYAFPYRALYLTPVVSVTDYDQRMLLMWSAYANRATAVELNRELKARDLEVVAMPANSLMLFDRRLGQFICGITGKRLDRGGGNVVGFGERIDSDKITWGEWRGRHPDTLLMLSPAGASAVASAPSRPILPQYKLRAPSNPEPATQVAMILTAPPAAIREDGASGTPMNFAIGATHVLLLHDGRAASPRAFDRHVKEDLFLTFVRARNAKRADVMMRDTDTDSQWTRDGRAVDGPLKGAKLKPIAIEGGLYWGVMKHWYPELELIVPREAPAAPVASPIGAPTSGNRR